MVRSSRTRSTSESCSSKAVSSSKDPASSILAEVTTLATACRKASRNSGWSSAITRWVLAGASIYFPERRKGLKPPRERLQEAFGDDFSLELSPGGQPHASAQYCHAEYRL